MKVPHDCGLVSFDVTSLFTNVPLEYTIDVILRKVYEEKLIKTDIPKKEIKELLLLCTKNVHFEFNGETFQRRFCHGLPLWAQSSQEFSWLSLKILWFLV